jgi:threonine synthase
VVVSEETLRRAHDLARSATGIHVDHTGSAGLAGLLQLLDEGSVDSGERVAVLFTGVER